MSTVAYDANTNAFWRMLVWHGMACQAAAKLRQTKLNSVQDMWRAREAHWRDTEHKLVLHPVVGQVRRSVGQSPFTSEEAGCVYIHVCVCVLSLIHI